MEDLTKPWPVWWTSKTYLLVLGDGVPLTPVICTQHHDSSKVLGCSDHHGQRMALSPALRRPIILSRLAKRFYSNLKEKGIEKAGNSLSVEVQVRRIIQAIAQVYPASQTELSGSSRLQPQRFHSPRTSVPLMRSRQGRYKQAPPTPLRFVAHLVGAVEMCYRPPLSLQTSQWELCRCGI